MFIDRLIDASQKLDYYGVVRVKESNLMCVSSLGWHRGMAEGFYHVFANDCRGVFIPQHRTFLHGFFVFPGV